VTIMRSLLGPLLGPALLPLALVVTTGVGLAAFDDDFTGATLRVDYLHTGTAEEEHFALDTVRIEGPWPGSRTQLVDGSNLGKYMVELADLATHRVLYSRGFASIYGEWETTGEARAGTWRSIPESVRVPEPRRPFQLRIRKRPADQSFREIWATPIDPASRFVDHAPLPRERVWPVVENGAPAVKVDLVILGDGYGPDSMERYAADARRAAEALFAVEPFRSRGGDFNVCPSDEDVFDVHAMADDALCQVETRRRWRELMNLGYGDALRPLHPSGRHYTFWDYQQMRWPRNEGLRIDHLMLSPQAADLLEAVGIDKEPRKLERPSDHTPVWARLAAW